MHHDANPGEYWNHNSAYHPWLVGIAARHRGDVLDVGCGDGLLAARLAPVSRSVAGIDADPASVRRAARRLERVDNACVQQARFQDFQAPAQSFDLITFVASLHHLPLRDALGKARQMLRPAGELAVVGLSANKSVADWLWAGLCLPVVAGRGVVAPGDPRHRRGRGRPRESLDEIRRVAEDVVPGAVIRRGVYYRYRLLWRNSCGGVFG